MGLGSLLYPATSWVPSVRAKQTFILKRLVERHILDIAIDKLSSQALLLIPAGAPKLVPKNARQLEQQDAGSRVERIMRPGFYR